MPEYRRSWIKGGTYFFTLVTNHRRKIFSDPIALKILREAFQYSSSKVGPFHIDAICILPDHIHCLWTLPEMDMDYATRWKLLKGYFSHQYRKQGIEPDETTDSKIGKGEVGFWQRRYWEHTIRNEQDLNHHIDYIHYNPVKHGLVVSVKEWPWSSFHMYVQKGLYDENWGNEGIELDVNIYGE